MDNAAPRNSPWAPALASILFTAVTIYLLRLYSHLHWAVLQYHISEMSGSLARDLSILLWQLEAYRFGALLALGFGIWALCRRPRWPGFVAIAVSVLAVLAALIVQ